MVELGTSENRDPTRNCTGYRTAGTTTPWLGAPPGCGAWPTAGAPAVRQGDAQSRFWAAALDDGRIAVRNNNHPSDGVVFFTRAEMDAWIKGVKAGEFDGPS